MTKKSNIFSELLGNELKPKIVIYPELQSLIPPLTDEEFQGLKDSIAKDGCREPILLWKNGEENILIDGHNRYQICEELKAPYQTNFKPFDNLEAVKDWMITNQLGRRNLTELQKSYLRGLQYNREKKGFGGDRKSEKSSSQNVHLKSIEKLAEEHKVSPKTIQRDEKFALGLDKLTQGDKELKDKILNKSIKVPQSMIQEASEWDDTKIVEAQKTLVNGKVKELLGELKKAESETDQMIKTITKMLKDASKQKLKEIITILEK